MRVVARAVVLGLAGLTAFGAAGCNRGGGTGTTTVIQQTVVSSGSASSGVGSTPTNAASVAPINDPKELCHQVLLKTRGLSNAVQAFWKVVVGRSGWSDADSDVADAVSRVTKESEQVFPAVDSIVGKGAPSEVADSVGNYLKTLKLFSDAIDEQQASDVLNPAASDFGHAKDKLQEICNVTK